MDKENKLLNLVPLTKIIATLCISMLAILLQNEYDLGILVAAELILFILTGIFFKQFKTLMIFLGFALFLAVLQYVFTFDPSLSAVTGLKMYAMGIIFLYLLVTTPLQDLTVSLVKQCGISHQYAFMLTAALRFIPDFVTESQIVREAQMCRGLDLEGSFKKRMKSYSSLIKPLVLRSLGRSETMALSLELRGFGSGNHRFSRNVSPGSLDYFVMGILLLLTIYVFCNKIGLCL